MSHVHRSRVRWAATIAATGALVAAGLAGTTAGAQGAAHPAAKRPSSGARPDPTFTVAKRGAAIKAAQSKVVRTASRLRMGTHQKLLVSDVSRDVNGTLHTRYQRTYNGLPVIGGDFIVHSTSRGATSTTFGRTPRTLSIAKSALTATKSSRVAPGKTVKKVVYADQHAPVIAYQSHVTGTAKDGTPIDELVFTDARTGKRLGTRTLIYTDSNATGSGKSLYSGTVPLTTLKHSSKSYKLQDDTRGNTGGYTRTYDAKNKDLSDSSLGSLFTDTNNSWGTGKTSSRQSAAVDAEFGAAETWDFYTNVMLRNGIRDDGVGAPSRVHYSKGYANAFWSDDCFCMTYGDGDSETRPLVALDVAGHEMTHGVTAATAGLDYFGDAGGLNESTSDVMGTMVEYYAGTEVPTVATKDPGDYLIGEEIIKTSPQWLRRMDNPHLDGASFNCWTATNGGADPHYSSGIGNHAFYLMAEGSGAKTIGTESYNSPVCSGGAVSQLVSGDSAASRLAAARIWYRALTTYWLSGTTYPQAADGMVKAAYDLYGASSSQCDGVKAAWQALNVTVTADCATDTGGSVNDSHNLLNDPGFELDNGSWTESEQSPNHSPIIVDEDLYGAPAHTGTHYAYFGDQVDENTGEPFASNDSISQSVTIPAGGETTLSWYMQEYSYEDPHSSVGGDPFTVEITDGATTVIKTYDALWALASDGSWEHDKISVPSSYNGHTVTLTFRSVNDDDYNNTGWLVDDVSLQKN